jgi:D-lyxose ketol-isomerase
MEEHRKAVAKAAEMLWRAGITITAEESQRLEVADFGLGQLDQTGLQIITYVNTKRCCAKELVLFPHQTCPEHWHPTIGDAPGKEETFRCRWGTVYLFVPGEATATPSCRPPDGSEPYYHVAREIILKPGEQYTLPPDTPHWFQAGNEGAVVSEFSTRSTDEQDVFRDPRIVRIPVVANTTLRY